MAFNKLVRRKYVLSITGWSKSTLYNRINSGEFPPSISIGSRAVGFVESEVDEVITAMIQGKSQQQLRDLVSSIINNRQQAA